MPSLDIKSYIIGGLGILLLILGIFSYMRVSSLENDLLVAQKETLVYQKESIRKDSALDLQTLQVESLKVRNDKALETLAEWNDKPVEVKYHEIIKYLPSKAIIQRNSCEDIKTYFSSTEGINLDNL